MSSKVTIETIRAMKALGEKIAALTAYDYPMTKLLDEAGIPLILVGDSLGMVVLGYPDTTHVTMAEMEHHVRAAARAKPNALLGADLPFKSYETPERAVENSKRLVAAGAEFVKAEGGRKFCRRFKPSSRREFLFADISVCCRNTCWKKAVITSKAKKTRNTSSCSTTQKLLADAGAFAIVLELVTPPVAKEISGAISIPTIGIGSGPDCDGQILVTQDLIGAFPWFTPRFVKPQANCAAEIKSAVTAWKNSFAKS